MTHKQPSAVAAPNYTGPGRTRLAPQTGKRGVVPALGLSSAAAGNRAGLVPGAPAPRMSGSSPTSSQPSDLAHLPSGISTRLEGGTEMAPHGVLDTYVNHGCRCLPCTSASAEYGRRRPRLRAYGRLEQLIPVETVATHLAWLSTQGVGWEQAATLAGVGRTTIEQILYPSAHRRGVTPRVAAAVMSVLPTLDDLADAALTPSAGTQRRLQALMVLGWPLTQIQQTCGLSALGRCLTRDLVTARTARAVRDFYDTHWTTGPTAGDRRAQAVIDRTRARAEQAGWLPPLAWDDDTIDDPDVPTPAHTRRPAKGWQRIYVDDIAELATQGATWAELEHRVGAVRNSIEIALTRAGRTELIGRITSNRWVAA